MESLAFLAFLIPLAGVGVVVLFIMAVIQQSRHERTGGFKQAFFTVVSMVMLAITIGSTIAILNAVAREYVFVQSAESVRRENLPPMLYFSTTSTKGLPEALTCETECELSETDKQQFAIWKNDYETLKNSPVSAADDFKRNLVGPLSFLIVSLPLYLWFMRMMEQGAKRELAELKKPTSLRQLYYYFVAFAGLLMAVIGAGSMINTGLKTVLGTDDPVNISQPVPALLAQDTAAADTVINCATACDFTEEDVALATEWKADYTTSREILDEPSEQWKSDLAATVPMFLVGLPLFWYHFARIRKETGDPNAPIQPTPATS